MAGAGAPGYFEDAIKNMLEDIYTEEKEQKDESISERNIE